MSIEPKFVELTADVLEIFLSHLKDSVWVVDGRIMNGNKNSKTGFFADR